MSWEHQQINAFYDSWSQTDKFSVYGIMKIKQVELIPAIWIFLGFFTE